MDVLSYLRQFKDKYLIILMITLLRPDFVL